MSIEGPRVLDKVLPGCTITTDGSGLIGSVVGGGWGIVGGINGIVAQREYFDLSGYNRKSLTTFMQGVELQYPGPLAGDDTAISLMEIISTEHITDEEIARVLSVPGPFSGPGFSLSTMNQEQIIYGRMRLYILNSTTTPIIPTLFSSDQWGTCAAATADKLHITRIVNMGSFDTTAYIPDVNVVIAAIIAKEKELPFLMRQKRSYELATGP